MTPIEEAKTTVKLIGGPYDGANYKVWSRQPCVYITKGLTREEAAYLQITAEQSWKFPECVYDRENKDTYKYRHTVHYKPREEGQLEIEA